MGFFVSITWIYLIANEVVGLLAMLGHIAGLSVGVLGLTVFAAGNSIGGKNLFYFFLYTYY